MSKLWRHTVAWRNQTRISRNFHDVSWRHHWRYNAWSASWQKRSGGRVAGSHERVGLWEACPLHLITEWSMGRGYVPSKRNVLNFQVNMRCLMCFYCEKLPVVRNRDRESLIAPEAEDVKWMGVENLAGGSTPQILPSTRCGHIT